MKRLMTVILSIALVAGCTACGLSEEGRAGRYINKSSKIKAFRDSVKAESPLLNQTAQNSIDLTEFSGYNDFKVIYLLGMFLHFLIGA